MAKVHRETTEEVGTVKDRTLCSCQSAIGGNTCCVSVPDACHIVYACGGGRALLLD